MIGPAFFLLIETSLTKGWRAAVALDLGVIVSDILCIFIAFYGISDIAGYIQTHPSLYRIGGSLIMLYGGYMFYSKPALHIPQSAVVGHNYFKTFANGFLMNILNIGIVLFWFVIVGWVNIQYPDEVTFFVFMSITLLTFFGVDLLKILLARRFQERLTDHMVFKIRKILGVMLFLFGLVIMLKGFFDFGNLEDVMPEISGLTVSLHAIES